MCLIVFVYPVSGAWWWSTYRIDIAWTGTPDVVAVNSFYLLLMIGFQRVKLLKLMTGE